MSAASIVTGAAVRDRNGDTLMEPAPLYPAHPAHPAHRRNRQAWQAKEAARQIRREHAEALRCIEQMQYRASIYPSDPQPRMEDREDVQRFLQPTTRGPQRPAGRPVPFHIVDPATIGLAVILASAVGLAAVGLVSLIGLWVGG